MLNKEECQKIVDRLYYILDKNINIMDINGRIIASNDKKRINSFHSGAKLCIDYGKELIISEGNQSQFKGCKPGINLPLYYEKRIIGVVGITGSPDDVRSYGLIVKELVEHIVHEYEHQQFKILQQEAMRSFIIELFNAMPSTDYGVLQNRAKLMGFSYDCVKTVVVGDIYINGNRNEGVSLEVIKQRILKTIKLHLDANDICLLLYDHLFVIIMNWRGNMETYLTNILQSIDNKYNIKLRLIIGGKCDKLEDYSKRFNSAKRVLDMNKIIDIEDGVHFANTYELELLLGTLDQRSIQEYLECYVEIFGKQPMNRSTKELIETIKVYYEQNMNIGETASVLFVHRNTIGYRLNKFKEQYKININKPYECMKLYIAIKLYNQKEFCM